jgi:hypothetical protein
MSLSAQDVRQFPQQSQEAAQNPSPPLKKSRSSFSIPHRPAQSPSRKSNKVQEDNIEQRSTARERRKSSIIYGGLPVRPPIDHDTSPPRLIKSSSNQEQRYPPQLIHPNSHHRASASLPHSFAPLRRLPMPVIQLFCDQDLRLLRFNDEAEELLESTSERLRQMTLYDLVHAGEVPIIHDIHDRMIREEMKSHEPFYRHIVSSVHPVFYHHAPPSALMMAAPSSSTYSARISLSHHRHKGEPYAVPYILYLFRSGAFRAKAEIAVSIEVQLYLCAVLVQRGFEHRVHARTEFQEVLAVDLTLDPTRFTNANILRN